MAIKLCTFMSTNTVWCFCVFVRVLCVYVCVCVCVCIFAFACGSYKVHMKTKDYMIRGQYILYISDPSGHIKAR